MLIQNDMPNIFEAFKKGAIEECMVVSLSNKSIVITGKISDCNQQHIYIKISEGYDELIQNKANLFYAISFITNRATYQIQHMALKYIEEHELFDILVHNPEFNVCEETKMVNYKFG